MNEIAPAQIVIIHDDIGKDDPIMVELSIKHGEENVKLFSHSNDGLNYVLDNLGKKMIVLLDKNFDDPKDISGLKVFEGIREKTSLVYIILISVSRITEISDEDLKMLINKDLFKFESFTSDYAQIIQLIDEAILSLSLRIDSVIEDWIMRHPPEKREQPLLKTKDDRSYSMNDILESIRKQTPIGVEFEKSLLKLAIELFGRQKIKIDD
ncbi:hypothetical protein [Mucilaginibacter gotjawali]|uniref:Uncharacterized protein n=2 Tax=Mucilaginibacter gotjawali TaxID=1550579 RepID=A0A839SIU4_9SPHI|nr:hypothetical protein [Mucilaginibacter gotjawali]MBB3057378.1 hypothetical protein [Mucilaginibacter gotjawali]BAU55503.1 hypothetical protein MgSA37_03692 [Mucilaginibacter gotjawali]